MKERSCTKIFVHIGNPYVIRKLLLYQALGLILRLMMDDKLIHPNSSQSKYLGTSWLLQMHSPEANEKNLPTNNSTKIKFFAFKGIND